MTEIDTTIKGGLPVMARGNVMRGDASVGQTGYYVEDLEITWRSGKEVSERVGMKLRDVERIIGELVSAHCSP